MAFCLKWRRAAILVAILLGRTGRQRTGCVSEAISSAASGAGCGAAEATENPRVGCRTMMLHLLLSVSVYLEQQFERVATGRSIVLWQAELANFLGPTVLSAPLPSHDSEFL